jgi:hypothetical protein
MQGIFRRVRDNSTAGKKLSKSEQEAEYPLKAHIFQ